MLVSHRLQENRATSGSKNFRPLVRKQCKCKEEMWWFSCLLSALKKSDRDSRTKLFLNEAYMTFPVLALCNELRLHLPRVLMWGEGLKCVCSQQRHIPTAEIHRKTLSTCENHGSFSPCSATQQKARGYNRPAKVSTQLSLFLYIWMCWWILLIMLKSDKNPPHSLLAGEDLQC